MTKTVLNSQESDQRVVFETILHFFFVFFTFLILRQCAAIPVAYAKKTVFFLPKRLTSPHGFLLAVKTVFSYFRYTNFYGLSCVCF